MIIGYHLTFLIIWSSWRFSGSKSNYWWPLPIPIDTISRAITRVKHIFNNLRFILWYVISRIYFLWTVISKKYFSWTVMRTLSPNYLCESDINFNSFSNIYFFTIINLDLNLFIFYIEINDFHPAKWIGDCYIHFGDKSIELKLDLLVYIHPLIFVQNYYFY